MALTSFMERPNYGSAQSSSPYPHGISRVPPSPPMDSSEPRISLPPISSLMQLAEAGSPTHEVPSPWHSSLFPRRSSFPATLPQHSPLNIVPLAPPVGPERLCQDPFSPGAHSSSSRASYRFETTPPLDDNFRPSPVSPHGGPQPTFFGHHASASSVHIHQQLPLPADFPPVSVVPPPNTWHGHYMSSASSSAFSHSQDRYVCSTCSKAFSRPSSLRIHNHSHTGEKPYRCSVQGCGKAFSVRSNMKRHERGCHQDGPMSPFTRSP